MKYEKTLHGYYIEVESLDYTKEFHEFKEDAEMLYRNFNEKSYRVPTSLSFILRYDGREVEDYHPWLSDGMGGLANKLQEWARLAPYYTYELDDDQKDYHINRTIRDYVYTESYEWLQETFQDAMDLYDCETEQELYEVFDFYNDGSLYEIASYLWDIFYDCKTMYEIDYIFESVLGRYGDAIIAEIPGDGYYLFFN